MVKKSFKKTFIINSQKQYISTTDKATFQFHIKFKVKFVHIYVICKWMKKNKCYTCTDKYYIEQIRLGSKETFLFHTFINTGRTESGHVS